MQGHGDEAFGHGEGAGTRKTISFRRDYCRYLWSMVTSMVISCRLWLVALLLISVAVFYSTFSHHCNVKEECRLPTFLQLAAFVLPLLLVIPTIRIVRIICADHVAELETVLTEDQPSFQILPPPSSALSSEIDTVNGLVGFDDLISQFYEQQGDDKVVYKLSMIGNSWSVQSDGDGDRAIIPQSQNMVMDW